ncbi:mechanosensitive ion channel family protein [Herbiconiux moechotypicola]|uniref:Mechanosensitive ion channel n=1 Tax=Herbiconiux moechotypicola TaxID=637393 RepID=A0ABN3DUD2_9MICO|nr:mechanosensitive ion channel family protein [Herbiconiux moechotypicola]MCS5731064.1 mechanosensitive ion channel family protein [Herbiconiux moechotypicola]
MPAERTWIALAIAAALALVLALAVTAVVALALRLTARRRHWPQRLIARSRIPFRLFLAVVLLWAAVAATLPATEWLAAVNQSFLIVSIAVGAWLACTLALFLEDVALARYSIDRPDNRVARRMRTQVLILRRLGMAVIVVIAFGAILLTFPGAQAVGTSVLASAGLVSIVAGLAAQSTLSNVFAGMQIAFSDAIRVDDVVIVENEWGRIEEITLTYVVVHIWDDRRMVLPSTYFTSQPFQNWTRRNSELLGSVEFDLDWRVTPAQMREELERILTRTELWDHRVSVLQVTDAVGGYVRVRILVTAVDAPTLFDLRCFIREEMIAWLYRTSPQSIPRARVSLVEQERDISSAGDHADDSGLFHGGTDAEGRASMFTGPIRTAAIPPEEQTSA